MYCGQCGKKVMENMLFCPFCGSPIVIPDQDDGPESFPEATREGASEDRTRETEHAPEAAAAEVEEAPAFEAPAPGRPVSLFDSPPDAADAGEAEDGGDAFVPLCFDDEAFEEPLHAQEEGEEAPETPETHRNEATELPPPERASRRPAPREIRRTESARKRAAQTYIPVKDVAPEDMFMLNADAEDDYDLGEDDYADDDYMDGGFDFEEPERGGFLQRHVRGVVGLVLLLVLLAICAIWAFSPKGQQALARVNLAWTAQPYADLGYEAYGQGSKLLAARYYEKALARNEANYEYAHSAMVSYYEAEDVESAAAMLKKCIAMNPDSPEPYQEMLILYPDAQSRPWEIQELIRQGYERTGSAALKQD